MVGVLVQTSIYFGSVGKRKHLGRGIRIRKLDWLEPSVCHMWAVPSDSQRRFPLRTVPMTPAAFHVSLFSSAGCSWDANLAWPPNSFRKVILYGISFKVRLIENAFYWNLWAGWGGFLAEQLLNSGIQDVPSSAANDVVKHTLKKFKCKVKFKVNLLGKK